MLFTVLSTGGFHGKPYSTLVIKINKTRKLGFIHEYHFVRMEKQG
jgi:hypothetical protein